MSLLLGATKSRPELRRGLARGIDKPSLIEGLALPELDTPEYAGTIMKDMIIERVLAQGGIRLAKLLNYLFADESALEEMEDYIIDVMTAY